MADQPPTIDFSALDANQLVEGLRGTLTNVTLSDEQQQMMREIVSRMTSYTSLEQTVQAQSQQVNQLQAQLNTLSQQAQVQAQSTQQYQQQQTKIKVEKPPKYNGDSYKLNNWLFSLEQYFVAAKITSEEQQCSFAATLLTEKALTWWRSLVSSSTVALGSTRFPFFKREIQKQFTDIDREYQLRRRLSQLTQRKSVSAYISLFRTLVLELGSGAPDESNQMYIFVEGLKPQIRTQVLVQRPTTLQDAMWIAERTDSAVYFGGKSVKGSGPTPMELGSAQTDRPTPKFHNHNKSRSTTPKRRAQSSNNIECWYCHKKGHTQNQCFKRQRDLGLGSKRSDSLQAHTPAFRRNDKGKQIASASNQPSYNKGKHLQQVSEQSDQNSDTSTSSKN